MKHKSYAIAIAFLSSAWTAVSCAHAADDSGDAFFKQNVEPILAKYCFECHSHSGKMKGGLNLDSRSGWAVGGETGPAIVPSKPEASLLIKALSYTDKDLTMPPKKKLSDVEIAIFTEWVRKGAPDPRITAASAAKKAFNGMTLESARSYWAFQPVRNPNVPATQDVGWAVNDVDRFVLSRLDQSGLKHNPQADPRALLRRVYFDLIGLPPTYEQAEKFAANPSREAFASVVDELLARPEYGQRWGRHWLDVARYSDTTEKSTDGERRIPFAHTYRDYVIDAFNSDKPFRQFVVEQIAADRLPVESHADLRALGFLTVGRRFEGNAEAPHLIIDDRIDVIGRGFLSLTLSCARCHDHKFDAIPTADYYSLYGILASSTEPLDLPQVGTPVESDAVKKYRASRASLLADYDKHIDKCLEKSKRLLREMAPEYLHYLAASSSNHRVTEGFLPLDTPRGLLVRGGPPRWEALIAASLKRGEPFFKLWNQFLALPRVGFDEQSKRVLADAVSNPTENDTTILAAFGGKVPTSMLEVADTYGRVILEALKPPVKPADAAPPSKPFVATLLSDPASPLQFTRDEIAEDLLRFITEFQLVSRPEGDAAGKLREKLTVLEASAPVERAMAVKVGVRPLDPHIFVRGDYHKPGAAVPRRFLQVLGAVDDKLYNGDGRLELAQAIASERNPLTARAIANRIWMHHFGAGLVATPDNFGVMGEAPSHPELLDHLASWFMTHDWSIKALHRYILSSATWQQSSAVQTVALEKDPGNRLLWRMAPRKIEFEPLREVAGRLDKRLGGRSTPLNDQNSRRAVYGYTDRFRIPALLRNFDVANPDTSISHRSESINPLQALYLLNSPFVRAQAEALIHEPEISKFADVRERIRTLYRRVFSHDPDDKEIAMAEAYLGSTKADASGDRQWTSFVQSLLLSNEFMFCD
ncbi:MAG: PSD1 and planctomycete cytochrome C domain-containing protein [Planctomycetota bacterium]